MRMFWSQRVGGGFRLGGGLGRIGCLPVVIVACLIGWALLPDDPVPIAPGEREIEIPRRRDSGPAPGPLVAGPGNLPTVDVPPPVDSLAPVGMDVSDATLAAILAGIADHRAAETVRLAARGYHGAELLDMLAASPAGRTRCAVDVWAWLVAARGERGAIATIDAARAAVLARHPQTLPAPGCLGTDVHSQMFDLFWRR